MPLLHAPPPAVHHARHPASPSTALSHLRAYLLAAQTHPALHPAADLTPEGPTFSAYGAGAGAASQLLERAARGLAGEYVAADPQPRRRAAADRPPSADARPAVEGAAEDYQEYAEAQEYATAVNSEAGEAEEGDEESGGDEEEEEDEEGLQVDEEERRARREEMKYARMHGDDDGLDGAQAETVVENSQEVIPDSQPVGNAAKERRRAAKGDGDASKRKANSKKRSAESQDLTPSKSVKWKLSKDQDADKSKAGYWDNRIKNWANAVPQPDSK